jgi:ornithine lipid ester-linked acyl 2-hydroxylase
MDTYKKLVDFIAFIFRRGVFWFGFYIRPPIHWFIGLFSKVGNPPVFKNDVFTWTESLESHYDAIRAEAMNIMLERDKIPPLRDVSPDHDRIAVDNKWQSLFIWGYNYKFQRNAELCPVTTSVVEKIPGLISAFYSVHAPGTHLPRHYGPTNGTITCHLGLTIPKEKGCRISVDDKEYEWHEGKCFVFDDTYYHEVWNDTEEDRIILLVQFERPLHQPGKALAGSFMWMIRRSPFIQTTLARVKEWEDLITDGQCDIREREDG